MIKMNVKVLAYWWWCFVIAIIRMKNLVCKCRWTRRRRSFCAIFAKCSSWRNRMMQRIELVGAHNLLTRHNWIYGGNQTRIASHAAMQPYPGRVPLDIILCLYIYICETIIVFTSLSCQKILHWCIFIAFPPHSLLEVHICMNQSRIACRLFKGTTT